MEAYRGSLSRMFSTVPDSGGNGQGHQGGVGDWSAYPLRYLTASVADVYGAYSEIAQGGSNLCLEIHA